MTQNLPKIKALYFLALRVAVAVQWGVLIDSIDLYFDLTLSGYEINLNWLNDYKPKVIGNIFENPEIISPDFDPIDFAKNIGVLKLYFF